LNDSSTLFFQNVLGFSPFEAGLRSLPVTGPILFVSPLSGRLTARVPVRLLLGTGLAFVTVGLLLMGNLSDSSGWIALLPGQILAGIGIGLFTAALASTAVGVVGPQLSGMASGANNTARQLGLATGIAGLGSIFHAKIESTLTPLVAGMPASSHVHELSRAVASGGASYGMAGLGFFAGISPATSRPFPEWCSHRCSGGGRCLGFDRVHDAAAQRER
jgi:fucose permease